MPSVAVIGAGLSGLTCARRLADCGLSVVVFEKGRGLGGRMATRRTERGRGFDHGAQFFTALDGRFQHQVTAWVRAGVVARWTGRVVFLGSGAVEEEATPALRFVGYPAMNTVCTHLAAGLVVRTTSRVAAPARSEGGWLVRDERGHGLGRFDAVAVSAPAPQAAELLEGAPALASRAAAVVYEACWAVLASLPDRLTLDFDGAVVRQSALSWIARNNSKPGRAAEAEAWVVHAAADWTRARLEDDPDSITVKLLEAFWDVTGHVPMTPSEVFPHRWRFARPAQPLEDRYLFDAKLRIGACGDWCGGATSEAAFLSGLALANAIAG